MTSTLYPGPEVATDVVVDVDVREETAGPGREVAGSERIGGSAVWVKFLQSAPDTVVVAVAGEIDTSSGLRLWEMLRPWLAAPTRTFIMDLSAVTFIDSDGVELLCDCQRRAETWSVSVRLATKGTSLVDRLIDLLGLGDRLYRYPSVSHAMGRD